MLAVAVPTALVADTPSVIALALTTVVLPKSIFFTTIPASLFSRAYLPLICDSCSQAIFYPCAIAISPRITPVDVVVA